MRVRTPSGPVLLGAALLYMLPLGLFLTGYLTGMAWEHPYLTGFAGAVLGVGAAVLYDRQVARKRKPQYTIIGY